MLFHVDKTTASVKISQDTPLHFLLQVDHHKALSSLLCHGFYFRTVAKVEMNKTLVYIYSASNHNFMITLVFRIIPRLDRGLPVCPITVYCQDQVSSWCLYLDKDPTPTLSPLLAYHFFITLSWILAR